MGVRCRNMTGIYLSCGEKMLLLYRQGGRVVSDTWVPSAGGHFERDELNDPEACVLRELQEELGLTREDLLTFRLRYAGMRHFKGELRQNYYFFADLKPERAENLVSDEGVCRWVDYADVCDYDMPRTAKAVMRHYMTTGRYTDAIYAAVSDGDEFHFTELREG
ncbi:MAG: NUDIX domain-containing protein [Clostridia bacterium]|nr:NUDIX domain-containing protein [Clostridia bacterium]